MPSQIWNDMFHLTLPVAEKMLRPVIMYLVLVILIRLFGKRELAQLNPFDLVVLLTLSNTVQNAIIGDDTSVVGGVIGAFALLGTNYVVVRFLYRHERLEEFVEGRADILIQNGRVIKARLDQEAVTIAELEAAAHRQGFSSLRDVDRAVLESGGTISFIGRRPAPETVRQRELLARLDAIGEQLAALRAERRPT
jgi:uncharacterized membrane protein YcaP (DUF421 family)